MKTKQVMICAKFWHLKKKACQLPLSVVLLEGRAWDNVLSTIDFRESLNSSPSSVQKDNIPKK